MVEYEAKIKYDKEADAAFIFFKEDLKSSRTINVNDYLNLDLDDKGKLIAIEVINISKISKELSDLL